MENCKLWIGNVKFIHAIRWIEKNYDAEPACADHLPYPIPAGRADRPALARPLFRAGADPGGSGTDPGIAQTPPGCSSGSAEILGISYLILEMKEH
jgi:hypothetical protein